MDAAANYKAWQSVQVQIESAVKSGMLSKEKAKDILEKARVSYRNMASARAECKLKERQ